MKVQNKISIINSINKIRLVYIFVPLIIILLLYFILPKILNYPPHSIDNDLQKEVDGLIYSYQFIFVTLIGLVVAVIFLFVDTGRIKKYHNSLFEKKNEENRQDKINKIVVLSIKMPIKLYVTQILLPLIFIPVVVALLGAEAIVIFKISIIFILFFSLSAVMSFVLSRKEFQTIIINLFEENKQYKNNIMKLTKSMSLRTKIILEIMPLAIIALVFTSLVVYVANTKIIGDVYFDLYQTELSEEMGNKEYKNKEAIKTNLANFYKDKEDIVKFIINEDESYDTIKNETLSPFFIKYALKEKEGKRAYDYYCIEREGTFLVITTNDNKEYLVGVMYETSAKYLLVVLTIVVFALFVLVFSILMYVASNLSKDIKLIGDRLKKIVEEEDFGERLIVSVNDETGELIEAYNKIQLLTTNHIEQIEANKSIIVEQERLVSLGQMIGGIAHNLKTPILSIAGAAEGIKQLAEEMEESLVTPTVTLDDKKEIIQEQEEWVEKIKVHLEYMNDVITAVKGQATTFTTEREESFTVKDLFKNVEILTSHEFKNGFATINIINNVPNNIYITGDFNSLLQVVNNIVVNAIQSYEKKGNNKVDLIGNISDETGDIIISIRDFGKGMSKDVQNKLFKQMVTTKGKYGTGLGLYMAYSTIKGKFGGDIKFDSEEGKGTVFHVVLSSYKKKENDLDSPGIISDLRPITGDTSDTIGSREDIYSKNDNIEDIKEEKKVEKENKIKEEKSEKKTTKKK